ncbi:MAG: Ig-like domain-containing protein, partial [Methanobrevibacter sp.]|nr:Ig-like domain-containing protein [Methanobrevibacter sp.]
VVKFNVHGRLYERTTNATGHAVLNINLEPEEYIITSYYKECREGNSIEVLPVLTASDLTMKYKDGSQFKAKLVDGQGKPYAGQKISFNINGVFYSRTTGSDGVAKLNINLQSGQYIITSEYNEYKISNTIKIGA